MADEEEIINWDGRNEIIGMNQIRRQATVDKEGINKDDRNQLG